MKIKISIIYLLICFSILMQPYALLAQVDSNGSISKTLTLDQIIYSLSQNPALLSFDEKIQSYGAYAKGARSWEAPKLSGGFWMTPYSFDPSMGGSIMLSAEQMIPNPSKQKAEQNYMSGMSTVEESMKNFEKQNMVEEAKTLYYEWLILKKKIKVLEESEQLIKLMIKSAEIDYTYNQTLLSRIYKAKSQLYELERMKLMLVNETREKNIELNTIMNISKETLFDIDTNYVLRNYDSDNIDSSEVGKNRSDIRNLEESIKLFNLKSNLELSKRKPDFGVQYGHMQGLGVMPNQFTLMAMVTIPVVPWAKRGYKANLEGLKYETASLRKKREALVNETLGQLQKTKRAIISRKQQAEMYEKNILPALEKNYKTSLLAFEHMKEDLFMALDALMSLKMGRIEYLNILGELLMMQVQYERQYER